MGLFKPTAASNLQTWEDMRAWSFPARQGLKVTKMNFFLKFTFERLGDVRLP
jgi:hypothetical protein